MIPVSGQAGYPVSGNIMAGYPAKTVSSATLIVLVCVCFTIPDRFASLLFKLSSVPLPLFVSSHFASLARP